MKWGAQAVGEAPLEADVIVWKHAQICFLQSLIVRARQALLAQYRERAGQRVVVKNPSSIVTCHCRA